MRTLDDIAVVVLAGGEGRRIGGGKPLRRLGGETLLARALGQAATFSDRVALAVRDPAQVGAPEGVTVIPDASVEGPLGGLAAALGWARDQGRAAVLTLPCDMPFVPPELGPRLGDALDGHAVVLAASGGRLHPVCGLWRVTALDHLPAYAASGRRSLWGFAEAVGFTAVDWPVAPADPFFNVNTAEDLAEAEARLG
ncbi:MAG: molybdenum cofactor guanylyltransferase [Brevundimonas sp.]|uniref:molybdenum cofactor guanylyltransferase n=1 Tax=Brevundimonas sp. TaxID=1871086 RepID=UPI00260DE624|nr:molybdenum cofactor guanylyltransferase [Brevundimonas sp.]MDI6623554.1 molybdenum cofactor guanylyltransferase [Brevundimonas sp.]MDQ7812696.1 molybdenum cofactor guanylyltransferase [Brevundimonas sp.]